MIISSKSHNQEMQSLGRHLGEHDLYHYFLDSPDMSMDAKAQMMLAWAKRHPRRILTNPQTHESKGASL